MTAKRSPLEQRIRQLLEMLREDTGADVVYLSRFADGHQHIRVVVGSHPRVRLLEGSRYPLPVTYCWRLRHRAIPSRIPDTTLDPRVANLDAYREQGIRGYAASAVHLPDGQVYGTICCVRHDPLPADQDAEPERARLVASLIARDLPAFEAELAGQEGARRRIGEFLRGDGLAVVFQPICDMTTGSVVGYEALSRFDGPPGHGPDWWLLVAEGMDLGDELELAMFRAAAAQVRHQRPQHRVSVNASPRLVTSSKFRRAIERLRGHDMAVEITERAVVDDFQSLRPALDDLKMRDWLIAVDDAGAGFAGFRHILDLKPDVIKLDVSLTRDIDHDHARQALATSLLAFGERIDVPLVVEGVETDAERAALLEIGYRFGQGYLLGHPGPLADAVRAPRQSSPAAGGPAVGVASAQHRRRRRQEAQTGEDEQARIAALVAENARLQAEAERVEEFLNQMTHEMRAPLSVVLGFAHRLEERGFPVDGHGAERDLRNILRAGDDMLTLVNESLDLARLRSGRARLEPTTFDVMAMVEELVESTAPIADTAGVKVMSRGRGPLCVQGDRRLCKQALVNLVMNAIKFAGRGGGVRVSVRKHRERVRVSVTDTGPGIALEDQERIFRPFEQVQGRAASTRGTGLGLTIARRMMEVQGGGVGLQSPPEGGAQFYLELPAA